jgi:hypothetical protein
VGSGPPSAIVPPERPGRLLDMGILVLRDVLAKTEHFAPRLVVYVAQDPELSPDSEVALVDYVGPATVKPPGMRHLLSLEDIRVVLDTWSKWRGGRVPNDAERCEAVAYYAKNDAYVPEE